MPFLTLGWWLVFQATWKLEGRNHLPSSPVTLPLPRNLSERVFTVVQCARFGLVVCLFQLVWLVS